MRKTASVLAIAGSITLLGAGAAQAVTQTDYPASQTATVSDGTIAPGESITFSIPGGLVRRTVQLVKTCTGDGYSQVTVKVTLANTAPADAATSLPEYVTGGGNFGVDPGRVKTSTVGYGPSQSRLQQARINGVDVPVGSFAHGNRPVGVLTTELGPGETATLEMDFSKVVQETEPALDATPTVQDPAEVLLPTEGQQSCN